MYFSIIQEVPLHSFKIPVTPEIMRLLLLLLQQNR